MSHDPHDADPRYSPDQVLYDGCHECARRSEMPDRGIEHMDALSFAAAWERAADWGEDQGIGRISKAEVPLLSALWSVQVQLEKRGIPIGECPGDLYREAREAIDRERVAVAGGVL